MYRELSRDVVSQVFERGNDARISSRPKTYSSLRIIEAHGDDREAASFDHSLDHWCLSRKQQSRAWADSRKKTRANSKTEAG